MKTWFNIKAAEKKATIVSIYDEIGAYGVSAKAFLSAVREITAKDISLEINSPGGDVFAGIAMYNGLRALADAGKTINVKIMGIAASAASLVAMAGDTIEMPSNTMMMVHNPWTFAMGDADEMRATADVLDGISNGLIATYAKRTGKAADEIKTLLDAETWLSAEEAVALGFATTVTDKVEAKAQFDVERLPESVKAAWVKASAGPDDEVPDADDSSATPETETLADQVAAEAKAAGFEAYAAVWVLDASITDKAAAQARVAQAREVKALCAHAGKPDMADALIRANKPVAEARAALFAALSDGQTHIDTAPPANNLKPKPGAAQPTAVKGADIWAARRAKFIK